MKLGLIALIMSLGFVSSAFAQDIAVVAGIRSDSADAEDSGYSIGSKTDWQVGGIAKFDVHPQWQIRTGFVYLQRSYDIQASGIATDTWKFTYFEIPVGIMYKFSDFGGAFIGPAIDLGVSKDCGSSTCSGVNSTVVPIQIGASFKFAPQMGLEFYYETSSSKIATGVENPKAVAANFMITFE